MDTKQNSASFLEKVLSFLKIKAAPKETQSQDRIAAGSVPNVGGPISTDVPAIDWVAPTANSMISPREAGQLFSPGQPLPPIAPPYQAGRAYNYNIVTNTQLQPRGDDAIKYDDLRTLADSCELIRLAIETRKGQMMRLDWNIVLRDPDSMAESDKDDPRITAIEELMRYPDGEHPFPTWMAMLLDQMLIFDAPVIYPHMNLDGSLGKLMIVDGATIKRVIDLWGRTPQPTEDVPNPPAYQQIIKGTPFVNFGQKELIYWPFNPRIDHLYGFSPTEQVLYTANMFMRRQSLQLNYFTEGTLPDFFFELPIAWTPEQIDNFTVNFYEMMKGNDAARRHGRFLPAGTKVNQTKTELLKDEFDEWLARIICFAFSLPPTAFVKQMNRASAEQAQQSAIEEGLAPLMIWFQGLMDYVIKDYFGYDDLIFKWRVDAPIDPLMAAQANKIYADNGILTKNEIRQELGFDPTDDGDRAFVIAGNTIVLMDDILAGKTAPPPPQPPTQAGGGNQPPDKPKPTGPAPKPSNASGTKVAKVRVKSIDRNRKAVEDRRKKLEQVAERALAKVQRDVLKQLEAKMFKIAKSESDSGGSDTPTGGGVPPATTTTIETIIADLDMRGFSILVDPTEELLEQVYNEGTASAILQIGLDDRSIVNHTNKQAIAYAKARAAELVTQVSDTTRDMLRGLVTQAMEENWTNDRLAKAIQESAGFGKYRATMIARTEIAMADVAGNMAIYRASGVKKKRWIKGSEHMIDDECDSNEDDGVIGIDDEFSSGDDAPPAHPNCVCDVLPVLDGMSSSSNQSDT